MLAGRGSSDLRGANMIRGIHGLFYSSDPDATRAFFKEKVKLPGSDIGEGWWMRRRKPIAPSAQRASSKRR